MTSMTSTANEIPVPSHRDQPLPKRMALAIVRFARQKPFGFVGLLLVLLLIFVAIFADQLAPYAATKIDIRHRLEGPSPLHRLGTDATGKDILSRLMYGARISMVVGFGAVIISAIGASTLGIISGYFGGWFDKLFQRFVDAWQAMPGLVILITVMGVVKSNGKLSDFHFMGVSGVVWAMALAIGVLGIAGGSRVIRSQVMLFKNAAFVEAAQSMGAGHVRIMLNCILPNVFPLILVNATVALGGVILAEASLSFLGLGAAGEPSWGQMLSVDGREYMRRQPGLAIYPGLCIMAAVFGFNIFGDALRDVLDPRLRK